MAAAVLAMAKRGYAATARAVGAGLTAARVLPDSPPPREQRLRHWAVSLTKVHDARAMAALDVPWWTYAAVDAVDDWLRTRPGARVFEWGAGASTLWLARRSGSVDSVEHHRSFAESMADAFATAPNARVRVVEPEPAAAPGVGSGKEGYAGLDFTSYVAAIDAAGGAFDLIVIDGRAREACLAAALPRLGPAGLIVFDNTLRRRYAAAIHATGGITERRYRGLTPTLPYPDCTSLISRSRW